MGKTNDILAELESLGATGDAAPAPPIETVEEVRVEQGKPSPALLDERGTKMMILADTLITEFDTFIGSATVMRDALVEMKRLWSPVTEATRAPEPAPAPVDAPAPEPAYAREEPEEAAPEPEEAAEDVHEEYGQGEPDALGNISLVVPEAVPLPPEVAALDDHSWPTDPSTQ
jgi:hypothetical protein